jgi:choline dehydrogenase-like flavoprotein
VTLRLLDGTTVTRPLERQADVVVVGSGPGGAACARELARHGLAVLIVEEGGLATPDDFRADAFTSMSRLYRGMGAQVTLGAPAMPYLQGVAVGGTSVINGAISWRLPRPVWQEWIDADPGLEEGLRWRDLETLFDDLERDLHIAPTDDAVAGPNSHLLGEGAEALGIAHRPILRNVHGCRGLGRCLQGCPGGHKLSMDRSFLDDACSGGAEILARVRAERVLVDWGPRRLFSPPARRPRAVGIAGISTGGAPVRLRARVAVVLAASAVQTPLLLLRSGLRHGPTGDGFAAHPGVSMSGRFADPVVVWRGATQGHEAHGLCHEGLKFESLGFDIAVAATRLPGVGRELRRELADLPHRAFWGAAVRARSRGQVRPLGQGARVHYTLGLDDLRTVRRAVSLLGRMMLAAGAEHVLPGVHGAPVRISDPAEMARFEHEGPLDPGAYSMALTHMFGTARMGTDPARSVVGPGFGHHAVDALHVADSSVFPSNTGVNPQTAILALATLAARSIVRGLG